jgi:hypothetical protein
VIFFREVQVGDKETVELWITNTGRVATRIRPSVDRSSPFELVNEGTIWIAPGLDTKMKVSYRAPDKRAWHSDLRIESNSGCVIVPMTATPPGPRLTSDFQFIKLGHISVDVQTKFSLSITNGGLSEDVFTIESSNASVAVSPATGKIGPGRSQDLMGWANPTVRSENNVEPVPPIEFTGTAVPRACILTLSTGEGSEIDFQTLYFCQRRVVSARLFNQSISKASFVVVPIPEHQNQLGPDPETVFTVTPIEGVILPEGYADFKFVFYPPPDEESADDIPADFA